MNKNKQKIGFLIFLLVILAAFAPKMRPSANTEQCLAPKSFEITPTSVTLDETTTSQQLKVTYDGADVTNDSATAYTPDKTGQIIIDKGLIKKDPAAQTATADIIVNLEISHKDQKKTVAITLKPKSLCTALNPSGLTGYDKRIPLVFVANSDFDQNIEKFKQLAKKYSAINTDPVTTQNFTVWMSETPGKNSCPTDSKMKEVQIIRLNSSDPDCGNPWFGFTESGGKIIWLCSQRIEEEAGNGIGTFTHELGHAQGKLEDEYYPSNNTPLGSNSNCFHEKGGSTQGKTEACNYFKTVVSSFDCSQVFEGCAYRTTGHWRAIDRGLMNDGVMGKDKLADFGIIGRTLFQKAIQKLIK